MKDAPERYRLGELASARPGQGARNLANQMNDPESKDAMLRIADDPERLTNRAEHRAAGRLPNWMKPTGAIQ